MKKITLFAAMAAVAMSANAQFTVADGSIEAALKDIPKATIDYVVLDAAKAEVLAKEANYTVNNIGPDDTGRFLYVWDGTMVAGDSNEPGVDGGNGYLSLNVGNIGWAGAGYCIQGKDDPKGEFVAEPADLSHINDNTIIHFSYRSGAGKISSMYVTLFNAGTNNVSIGETYESNPVVGPAPTEEWQTVQMTIGDYKKLKGSVDLVGGSEGSTMAKWCGNILAFGGTPALGFPEGANICFDGIYFITPGEGQNAIENITVDGNEAAVYYNLQGQRVANPTAGQVYIVKAGNDVKKVVL